MATKTQASKLNKQADRIIEAFKDLDYIWYKIVDYRHYETKEEVKCFQSHDDAKEYLALQVGSYKIPTKIEYIGDSNEGKYQYLIKQLKPMEHIFVDKAQAYRFVQNDPDVIIFHDFKNFKP